MKYSKQELKSFYISQIEDNFVPYWNAFADDKEGGILNCINNYGDKLLSGNKFTWSQGRYLWILGRLHDLNKNNVFTEIDSALLEKRMSETYNFITIHAIYGDSLCCYVLDRTGKKLLDERTQRYDASIFADCFALIGLAQYIKTMQVHTGVPTAEALYKSIVKRIDSGNFATEPYPIPAGYVNHSIPMIMVNTVYEYIKMREKFGLSCTEEIACGLHYADIILTERCSDNLIREFSSTNDNFENRLLDRHINPGHTIEDIWFLFEYLHDYGDLKKNLPRLCAIAKKAFSIGWDDQYGGLFRFVDKEGGKPRGTLKGDPYETLIADTWDMKLWWPHSEMLYTFLLLFNKTTDIEFMDLYKQAHDYAFAIFPNKELGEWIQIRKRDGTPEEKLVALPVKDPFHILRNFIKVVELCSQN